MATPNPYHQIRFFYPCFYNALELNRLQHFHPEDFVVAHGLLLSWADKTMDAMRT